jgi:hypothetical protein
MRRFVLVAAMVLVSAGAQAGQSRSLSLAGSDSKAVQVSAKTSGPTRVVETPKAPRAADATSAPSATDKSKSFERPKFVERPPGADVRRQRQQSQMADSAPHRRRSAHISRPGTHRAGHIHPNTSRIVAALHRHGFYW